MKLNFIEFAPNMYDIFWTESEGSTVDDFVKSILESGRKERGSVFDANTFATIATFNCTKETPSIRTYDEKYSKMSISYCTAEKRGDAMYYMVILDKKGI